MDAHEYEKAKPFLLQNLSAKALISTTDVLDLREQISREALKFAMKLQELMRSRRTNEEEKARLENSLIDDMLGELFINMAEVFSFKKDKNKPASKQDVHPTLRYTKIGNVSLRHQTDWQLATKKAIVPIEVKNPYLTIL